MIEIFGLPSEMSGEKTIVRCEFKKKLLSDVSLKKKKKLSSDVS